MPDPPAASTRAAASRLETGARRWYDAPDRGGDRGGGSRAGGHVRRGHLALGGGARVDHVEVYAVSKAAFGWDREAALARGGAGSGAATRADAGADAESDAESDAEATSKTATRLERIVRHADGSEYDSSMTRLETREEERALRAALASLARAAAFEDSAETKEKAAALALRVLEPFDEPFDGIPLWMPRVATRRVAWRALLAATGNSGDSVAAAAARKDASAMASITERVTRLLGVPARRGPAPADALAFHRAARAAARCAFRRPAAFAGSPAARAASAAMVRLAEDMLEAGAGAWDAEEFAGHLATLAVAVAESAHERKPPTSSESSSPRRRRVFVWRCRAWCRRRRAARGDALLAGRDDARRAAADALTDALVAGARAPAARTRARAPPRRLGLG